MWQWLNPALIRDTEVERRREEGRLREANMTWAGRWQRLKLHWSKTDGNRGREERESDRHRRQKTFDSKRRKDGDGGTGKERRTMSGNDNATERDPKLIQGPRSFSVPEWNKKADKVIRKRQREKEKKQSGWPQWYTQHGYWHFHLTFVRAFNGRGLEVIDLLLNADVY